MNSQIKISIPEPCHEDWNKMIPNEKGRFCQSCSKTVVDFTTMLPDDIKNYFLENRGKSICGRIKQSQLDSIVIQIPRSILYSQTNYHHFFLLALFAVMGTTLFSCADKEGNKKKIDKVEIVEDSIVKKNPDSSILETKKETKSTMFYKSKKKRCTKKINSNSKIIDEGLVGDSSLIQDEIDNTIYSGVAAIDVKPDFKGGLNKFYSLITQNYKLPQKAKNLNGEIRASFVIEKDGSLSTVTLVKDLGFGTGEELKRVLLSSPKWYPGEQNGKRIRERFEIRFIVTHEIIKRKFWFPKNVAKIDSLQLKIS
ncbi:MAG: hypothetical protein RIT22_1591 [Bacteroidota bacterium]|jgi:hypothetical protein